MAKPVDSRTLQETVAAWEAAGRDKAAAAKALGIRRGTVIDRLKAAEAAGMCGPTKGVNGEQSGEMIDFQPAPDGETGSLLIRSKKRITTEAEALEFAGVDSAVWQVTRKIVNFWDQGYKDANTQQPGVQQLYQLKLFLSRIVPANIYEALDRVYDRMPKYRVKFPKLSAGKVLRNPHMVELDLFDVHFGKLAWSMETGENYDLQIAKKRYMTAFEQLLSHWLAYDIEEIHIPIGQDCFHVDNWFNTTERGTPQHHDGRFPKVFDAVHEVMVECINRCLISRNVKVKIWYVPGNHDRSTSWYLVRCFRDYYRDVEQVEIDQSPASRKMIVYGNGACMLTHGDRLNQRDLPSIAAKLNPAAWINAVSREIHMGHFHKKREMRWVDCDEHTGDVVRVLRSLSGTDQWHFEEGYVGGRRAAESFLWHKRDGQCGQFSAFAAA